MRKTLALLTVITAGAASYAQAPARVDFGRDVQPILRQQCYGCHGPSQQMNGFRLDRRKDAMRGGTANPGIIRPGDADVSFLMIRITGNSGGPQMPPTGALPPEQIATLKAWIDQGAEWPDEFANDAPPAPIEPRNATLLKEALWGTAASVRRALDAGGEVNTRSEAGATPLMWAVSDLEKTRVLLDRGANVNAKSADGRTALLIASGFAGAAPVVQLLLDRGAAIDIKAPGTFGDESPLSQAAYIGDAATFQLLLNHGADVNAAGPLPLGYSLRSGCMVCADTLFKSIKPEFVTTALYIELPPLGNGLRAQTLFDHGADPKLTDGEGHTMIARAAASDLALTDTIKGLIAKGVDASARAKDGMTALSLARRNGWTPLVDLLRNADAANLETAPAAVAPSPAASIRAAVERSLPLLQRTDAVFLKKSGCVSCHNDTLTAMSVAAARSAGIPVDETTARSSLRIIGAFIDGWRERAIQGVGIPGDADTISYILVGLDAERHAPDAATDAMAFYLKRAQFADGGWRNIGHRPPLESSDVQTTALSMRALQAYAPAAAKPAYAQAVRRASAWLAATTPRTNEDQVFQLLGLAWSRATRDLVQKAGRRLVSAQRADGGWAQLSSMSSDAYATGQALVALMDSGIIKSTDGVYKRGVDFLLKTQFADGSWLVRTRALPIQPLFDIGFPHGLQDSWISAAGTNWATLALTRAYVKPS